jgi:hypothetical protein
MAVTTIGRRQRLHLHVVLQHQLVRIWVQIHLLVDPRCPGHRHPIEDPIAVAANPSCRTRLKRQDQLTQQMTMTTRIQIRIGCTDTSDSLASRVTRWCVAARKQTG